MKTLILTLLLVPTFAFASIDTNLRLGNKGSEVTKLQTYLVEKGYNTQVTGYFGVKTLFAVKKFQFDNELPSTGYVGMLTRNVMNTQSVTSTGSSQPIATTTVVTATTSATTTAPIQTSTTTLPLATTTATTLPKIVPVYNKPMNEETTVTLGTPYITHLKEDVYRGFIPVTITNISGKTVIVDGTIPEPTGTGLNGIGTEFNSRSSKPYLIPLEQVRGNYSYTITIKDNKGDTLSETTGSMNIPKFDEEK